MPTYEYICSKCGGEFDARQTMSEKSLTQCTLTVGRQKKKCAGRVSRKIGAGAGLIFKGSGFYITDYRSEGYKQSAKKDSDSSKPATATTSTDKPAPKTESKTEAKPAKAAAKK